MRGRDALDRLRKALGVSGAAVVGVLALLVCATLAWQGGVSADAALGQPANAGGVSISGGFDHFKTGFPLTDAHRAVACESCHMGGVFKSAPRTCAGCHDNRMAPGKPVKHIPTSQACDTCHTAKNWTVIRFEHSQTSASCVSCHNNFFVPGKPPTHFPTNANCDSCHRTSTWVTAVFDHSQVTQPCATCHNNVAAEGKPATHIQTSAGCDTCHITANWTTVNFDHSAVTGACATCHNGTTAEGKPPTHIATNGACDACHITANWTTINFDHTQVTGACATCHNGTTAEGQGVGHISTTAACDTCHITANWTTIHFDHSAVVGACATCHNGVIATGKAATHIATTGACDTCHKSTTDWTVIQFDHTSVSGTCASCHNGTTADGKGLGGAFHINSNTSCGDCHTTANWTVAANQVNHNDVIGTCASCHNGTNGIDGQSPTHITVPGGIDCGSCHGTLQWTGANYNHSGSAGLCATCHTGTDGVTGKPANHFVTTHQCDDCHHSTTSWTTSVTYTHPTGLGYWPGTGHNSLACSSCHASNSQTPTYSFNASYAPNCAACHGNRYQPNSHPKGTSPQTYYTVVELQNCSGACHNGTGHHTVNNGNW